MPAFQIIYDYQKKHDNPVLGDGNGWDMTYSVNDSLIKFFDTYLKAKIEDKFIKCRILSNNTYIQCGPTIIPPM